MNGKLQSAKLIEVRSIDFVPEDERHGRVAHQSLFWFLGNFHFFAIAIGFVGPSMGLSMPATILAGTLGMLIGTTFQAFHASQGPEMGLPQMIQSRAQFGFRGVMIPLVGVLVTLNGYNVVATVLIAEGAKGVWGLDRTAVALAVAAVASVLAIFGHDWLHRAFRLMFWVSLPLFLALSLAIVVGHAGGGTPPNAHFGWPAFLAQLAAATSFNLSAAPYVSDYSRYLPRNTSRLVLIANVFGGSAISGIWLVALGAWLATRMGATDALVALRSAGDAMAPGMGSVLVCVSICALIATIGMTSYSAMMTFVTATDCVRPVRPTRRLRVLVILGVTVVWAAVAICFGGNAIAYVNGVLVITLYFLIPWTTVNLIDYFFLSKGRYLIADLATPRGVYGAWGLRGLFAYAVGFVVSIPFFVVPGMFIGPAATRLAGCDIGWLVSLVATALAYLAANIRVTARAATPAILSDDPGESASYPPEIGADHAH
jgi:purine-cytosine permease-like protein